MLFKVIFASQHLASCKLDLFIFLVKIYQMRFKNPWKSMMKDVMYSIFVSSQNKIKVVALKITNNINVLIKVTSMNSPSFESLSVLCQISISFIFFNLLQDLFHNPPSYKSTVTLSWKPVQKTEAAAAAAAIGYVFRSVWMLRSPYLVCLLKFLP